jgi:hypothetical protein
MAIFGKHVPLTWANGGVPAINDANLNEYERIINGADLELSRSKTFRFSDYVDYYFQRNFKEIENFSAVSEFSEDVAGSMTNDTTYNVIGKNSVRITEPDASAGTLGIYKTVLLNLEKFNDGSVSSADDKITCIIYVSDKTKVNYVQIKLGTNSTNFRYARVLSAALSNGYNTIDVAKSDFVDFGAPPDWDTIIYARFDYVSTASATAAYVTFIYCGMYRENGGYNESFQRYMGAGTGWVSSFTVNIDWFLLVYCEKIHRSGTFFANPSETNNAIQLYSDVINFICKFEWYCKTAGELPSMIWYVDANNYVKAYVSSSTLYMYLHQGGVGTTISSAFTNALAKNERVVIMFDKSSQTCRVTCKKEGELEKICEYETSITATDEGAVCIGATGATSYGLLTDFVCSHMENQDINKDGKYQEIPKYYRMTADQQFLNNTMTAITGLVITLPPNGVYVIDAHINAKCIDTVPDIKFDWNVTGTNYTLLCERNCRGGESQVASSTTFSLTRNSGTHGLATDVCYPLANSTTGSHIQEHFVIETFEAAITLQYRAAQINSDATNPSTVQSGSHIIVQKVKIAN